MSTELIHSARVRCCATRYASLLAFACVHLIFVPLGPVAAQDAFGAPAVRSTGPSAPNARPRRSGPNRPNGKPPQQGEKKADEKKEGDDKDGAKEKEAESAVVKRPEKPAEPADPSVLKTTLGEDGKVRFNFRGHEWPDVLNWLAREAKLSLDWQELPKGYLNLTTQRRYTIDEARDMINRHLLARGYTMLVDDEVVTVVKLDKLDPGMVPRVAPDELDEMLPHEFAKVSFQLEWLLAEQAAKELEPMKSPHGKLVALSNTNRLEALDIVTNLREIRELLRQEQTGRGQERLMRQFSLTHVRAADVVEQLQKLLGIETTKQAGPMTPQQMQAMQRQQQRMMQQMQQQGKNAPAPPKEAKVNLVANSRLNSILAHAPPDKMAIIEQAIQTIDVPQDRTNSLIANPDRMRVYRLHALNPQTVVDTLDQLGELDPSTRLEVDEENKAIIAYASLADQMMIRQLVDRLDGSGRRFEVMKLRRLAADYVAGTIEFMMGPEEEETNRRPYYYFGSRNQQDNKPKDKFRVDADLENNYLLLWATEIEIEEVRNLLVKLGELPPEGGRQTTMRVLDPIPADELEAVMERLRRAWPSLAPNPLTLPPVEDEDEAAEPRPRRTAPKKTTEARTVRPQPAGIRWVVMSEEENPDSGGEGAREDTDRAEGDPAGTSADDSAQAELRQKALESLRSRLQARQQPQPEQTETPPPVNIAVGPDGRLIITSNDPAALDVMEELLSQLAPRRPPYRIFKLKYADAFYVRLNLVDFFEEEEEDDSRSRGRVYIYDYYGNNQKDDKKRFRLSERRKLKFIDDYDTNSILVQGADAEQLQIIEELIDIYDRPEPPDSQSARLVSMFQIEHSRADLIAESIKEVYRDLLSSNDKALAGKGEQKNRQPSGTTYIFGGGNDESKPERTHVNFKGKLSLGVDALSNTLIVSAEGETLMSNIKAMVEHLDQAAQPLSNVEVIKVGGGVDAGKLRDVVAAVVGATTKTGAKSQAQNGNNQQGQNNRGRGRGNGNGNRNGGNNGGGTPAASSN